MSSQQVHGQGTDGTGVSSPDARMLADALEAMEDGIVLLDPSCRVTFANARAERALGCSLSTLKGRLPWEVARVPGATIGLSTACRRAAEERTPVPVACDDVAARLESRVRRTASGFLLQIAEIAEIPAGEARSASVEHVTWERDLFRAIFEQMPQGTIVAAPSGRLLFANRAFEKLFGGEFHGADGIDEYSAYVGFHPDGRRYETTEWPLARSLLKGEIVDERIVFRRRDGRHIVIRVRSGPVYGHDRELIAGIVFSDDVTEEVQALRELTVTKSLLQGIMDHSTAAIFAKAPSGRYLFANPHFKSVFRTGDRPVVGSTDYDLFPRASADTFRASDRQAVVTGAPIEYEVAVPVEGKPHTFITVKFPVKDDLGRVYAVGGVSTDITERARAQRERDATLALLDTFLASSPAGFAVLDPELRYTRVNPALADINGLPAEAHLGKTPMQLFPDLPLNVIRWIRSVLETGEPVINVEIGLDVPAQLMETEQSDDPRRHHFLGSFHPIRIAGRIEAVGAMIVDITEQKALARQLRREGELRELFMAVLAHDLRNPLSSITLAAQTVLESPGVTPSVMSRAQLVVKSARRMSALIEQLLDFSRIRSGAGLPVTRRPCDLLPVCAQVIHEIEASHPDRVIAFSSRGDTSGTWDPDRMSEVVSNLVNNAVTYSPEATSVTVELTGDSHDVALKVENRGAPIPSEKLSKLFQPFERANRKTRSPSEGLGLGLFIADQVVRAHGGRIDTRSDDEATVFEVHLPR